WSPLVGTRLRRTRRPRRERPLEVGGEHRPEEAQEAPGPRAVEHMAVRGGPDVRAADEMQCPARARHCDVGDAPELEFRALGLELAHPGFQRIGLACRLTGLAAAAEHYAAKARPCRNGGPVEKPAIADR